MKKQLLILSISLLAHSIQAAAPAGAAAGPAAGSVTHTGAPAAAAPAMAAAAPGGVLIAPLNNYRNLWNNFSTLHFTHTPPAFIIGALLHAPLSDDKAEKLAEIEVLLAQITEFEHLIADPTVSLIPAKEQQDLANIAAKAKARLEAEKLITQFQKD